MCWIFLISLDDCIWGPWLENECDYSTNAMVAKRIVLRNGTGDGVMCQGEVEELRPCVYNGKLAMKVFRNNQVTLKDSELQVWFKKP